MNLEIKILLDYAGPLEAVDELIDHLATTLADRGFASAKDDDDAVVSLIILKETDRGEYTDPVEFFKHIAENAITIYIPLLESEVEDESSSGD